MERFIRRSITVTLLLAIPALLTGVGFAEHNNNAALKGMYEVFVFRTCVQANGGVTFNPDFSLTDGGTFRSAVILKTAIYDGREGVTEEGTSTTMFLPTDRGGRPVVSMSSFETSGTYEVASDRSFTKTTETSGTLSDGRFFRISPQTLTGQVAPGGRNFGSGNNVPNVVTLTFFAADDPEMIGPPLFTRDRVCITSAYGTKVKKIKERDIGPN